MENAQGKTNNRMQRKRNELSLEAERKQEKDRMDT